MFRLTREAFNALLEKAQEELLVDSKNAENSTVMDHQFLRDLD